MRRLCANTMPFYKGLEHRRFWCLWGSWNQSPVDAEGQLYTAVMLLTVIVLAVPKAEP